MRVGAFLRRYDAAQCGLRASAVGFAALWALAPSGLLFLAALGWFFPDPAALVDQVVATLARAFPGRDLEPLLKQLVIAAGLPDSARRLHEARVGASLAGVAAQLWTGSGLMAVLSEQIDAVLGARPRPWHLRRAVGLGFFLLAGGVLVGAFLVSVDPVPLLRSLPRPLGAWVGELSVFLVATLLFALTYRILPGTPVAWPAAWRAGGGAAALWCAARLAITLVWLWTGGLPAVYGVVSGALALLAWVWATFAIILGGAVWIGTTQAARYNGTAP